jgi:hypothetical protein
MQAWKSFCVAGSVCYCGAAHTDIVVYLCVVRAGLEELMRRLSVLCHSRRETDEAAMANLASIMAETQMINTQVCVVRLCLCVCECMYVCICMYCVFECVCVRVCVCIYRRAPPAQISTCKAFCLIVCLFLFPTRRKQTDHAVKKCILMMDALSISHNIAISCRSDRSILKAQ